MAYPSRKGRGNPFPVTVGTLVGVCCPGVTMMSLIFCEQSGQNNVQESEGTA
jgi:hypothetical protein